MSSKLCPSEIFFIQCPERYVISMCIYVYTLCLEKSNHLYTLSQLLQTMSGFNRNIDQQLSNCKQITTIKLNLSTLTIVLAGLVRPPQNKSAHYRQPHRRMTVQVSKCTSVQISNITKVCVKKCPLCARMQAQRCGRHCLIASSMNTWWKCSHSSIRHNLIQLVNVMNLSAIHTLLQLPPNLVVYRAQVRTVGWPQS